jgi:hypothetical protein
MPVMLMSEDYDRWLGPSAISRRCLSHMTRL